MKPLNPQAAGFRGAINRLAGQISKFWENINKGKSVSTLALEAFQSELVLLNSARVRGEVTESTLARSILFHCAEFVQLTARFEVVVAQVVIDAAAEYPTSKNGQRRGMALAR